MSIIRSAKENKLVPVTTSPDKRGAAVHHQGSGRSPQNSRTNAIPYRRIGKYVRFTQDDLKEIISSSEQSRNQMAGGV
jgi:hypothetical protein